MQHFFRTVEKLSTYNILFKGLKEGSHVFDFQIGDSFFEHFENSLINQAAVKVQVTLEKHSSFLALQIRLEGTVRLMCDRCLDWYDQPVEDQETVFVKFGETESEEGDDVIWILPEEYQINVAQLIYEYISISVPLKHVHPDRKDGKSGCDPEMLEKLEKYTHHEVEKTDERWDELKKLLNNN